MGFSVKHLMVAKTRGRFGQFHGSVVIADDPLDSSVEVEIDMASVDTRDEQRDGHLRSADFFDVEQYPTMSYRSTAVTPAGAGKWTVDGELTAHGVTAAGAARRALRGRRRRPLGQRPGGVQRHRRGRP